MKMEAVVFTFQMIPPTMFGTVIPKKKKKKKKKSLHYINLQCNRLLGQ